MTCWLHLKIIRSIITWLYQVRLEADYDYGYDYRYHYYYDYELDIIMIIDMIIIIDMIMIMEMIMIMDVITIMDMIMNIDMIMVIVMITIMNWMQERRAASDQKRKKAQETGKRNYTKGGQTVNMKSINLQNKTGKSTQNFCKSFTENM